MGIFWVEYKLSSIYATYKVYIYLFIYLFIYGFVFNFLNYLFYT